MIIGVDPGTTTGLVIWWHWNRKFQVQCDPVTAANHVVEALVAWPSCDAVVCERYDITPGTARKSPNPDPYHLEGWLRLECGRRRLPFFRYGRSDAKNFVTDEKLKRLNLYETGSRHVHDAWRQVVFHLAETPQGRLELARVLGG